jgi:peptidoglycan/xylan/chitin deacetylase (PgdA/CDA1 family)
MPKLLQWLYPQRVWAFSSKKPTIYLTFDDGPIPKVTPWVLELLKKQNAKATFFCIGDNVKKHPEIFKHILAEGHSIGNHTFHHLKGTETTTENYLKDIALFENTATVFNDKLRATSDARFTMNPKTENLDNGNKNSKSNRTNIRTPSLVPRTSLFRPPYGKMTSSQAKKVVAKGYKIVMWDVLSADFDPAITAEECLKNVLHNIKKGSVVVFHDSLKAEERLRYVLPKLLEFASSKGWECSSIPRLS